MNRINVPFQNGGIEHLKKENKTETWQGQHYLDVVFPSVCCKYALLPLVNKEADLANSQVANPCKDTGRKKVESERCHQTLGKEDVR